MICEQQRQRKLRVLCFHGFRTSGAILEKQIRRWDDSVLDLMELTFLDGPFLCGGKSDVEGIFPPPYYEWYQFNKDYTRFDGLEDCIKYVSDFVAKHGPFDGLLGFSQGAVLSAAFAGYLQKARLSKCHPPFRFVIIISGAVFNTEQLVQRFYPDRVDCRSLHFIGNNDWFKPYNELTLERFENPIVIRHEGKHVVPRLGENDVVTVTNFLRGILESYEEATQQITITESRETVDEPLSEIEVTV